MKIISRTAVLFLLLVSISCSSDDGEKDIEKPRITLNYDDGFPQTCMELGKGNTYTFRAMVTDNDALASFSIDIHHNFDHHTHDDQLAECEHAPIKAPVSPFVFMESYPIEGNLSSYEITVEITIPEHVDTGDYHCQYSVIDQTGWQSRTSVDIKIVE